MTKLQGWRRWALVALVVPLAGCGVNDVPTKGEAARKQFADLQAQYQRRSDLIPNLVATVQGYAKQERDVLIGVTEARAKATQVQINPGDLSDPAKVEQYQQAQNGISGALSRLLVASENYPELKSNQNFLALQDQLEGTENRITIARQNYNEAVRDYNLEFGNIPDKWVAGMFHSADKPMAMFQASPAAQTAPKVTFN